MDSPLEHHRKPTSIDIVSSAAFVAGFEPPDYLIEDIIMSGFVYALTAKTGEGKTAVALRLAAHVALGQGLMPGGPSVKKGRVLYFAGENDEDVKMRWIKLAAEMKFDPTTIGVDFYPGRIDLKTYSDVIAKHADQTEGGYVLVIIDTSQAFFYGTDENNRREMLDHAMVLRGLTRIKGRPAVLVLCHPIKNWTHGAALVPSGGGSFLNEIDGNLTLMRLGSSTVVEMFWAGKFRGPEFKKCYFELIPGTHQRLITKAGKKITTVFAKPIGKEAAERRGAASRAIEERVLVAMMDGIESSLSVIARKANLYTEKGSPNKQLVSRVLKNLGPSIATKSPKSGHWGLTQKGREEAQRLSEGPL
jgi:hypothetical protein